MLAPKSCVVSALLADGRARAKLEGHEIIQSAPTTYVVDEARGVKNPSGMFCQRIGVAMHAVAVRPSPLQQNGPLDIWGLTARIGNPDSRPCCLLPRDCFQSKPSS